MWRLFFSRLILPACGLQVVHACILSDSPLNLEDVTAALADPGCRLLGLNLQLITYNTSGRVLDDLDGVLGWEDDVLGGEHDVLGGEAFAAAVRGSTSLKHLGLATGSSDLLQALEAELSRGLTGALRSLRVSPWHPLDARNLMPFLTVPLPGLTHLCVEYSMQAYWRDMFTAPLPPPPLLLANEFVQTLAGSEIRHLTVKNFDLVPVSKQRKVVAYFESNIGCLLETLHLERLESDALKSTCDKVLRRNKIYREGNLMGEGLAQPLHAKLFLCGDSRVGKTTIRKKLCRQKGWPRLLVPRHSTNSTSGIELKPLSFGDQKLIICDLAEEDQQDRRAV